jgi:hypothetical protein
VWVEVGDVLEVREVRVGLDLMDEREVIMAGEREVVMEGMSERGMMVWWTAAMVWRERRTRKSLGIMKRRAEDVFPPANDRLDARATDIEGVY